MPAKVRTLIDVHEQNAPSRFNHYDWKVVRPQLDPAITITETFLSQKAAIDADPHLTPKGKEAARVKAAKDALEALGKWTTPRIAGLDADLATRRAALMPKGETPDPRRVEFMASRLLQYTQDENRVFYTSSTTTDEERLVMEAASALVGRVPMKTGNGQEMRPLLDPETVNETFMARAAAKNPQGVARLNELAEIRALHVTVANHAVAEIREALGGVSLDA